MTSLTPRSPRRVSERRKSVQNGSASLGPTAMPSTSRTPSVWTATAIVAAFWERAIAEAQACQSAFGASLATFSWPASQ